MPIVKVTQELLNIQTEKYIRYEAKSKVGSILTIIILDKFQFSRGSKSPASIFRNEYWSVHIIFHKKCMLCPIKGFYAEPIQCSSWISSNGQIEILSSVRVRVCVCVSVCACVRFGSSRLSGQSFWWRVKRMASKSQLTCRALPLCQVNQWHSRVKHSFFLMMRLSFPFRV